MTTTHTQHNVGVVRLTPEIAAAWLATSTLNRRLRDRVITMYAREMQGGRWHLSPDAIAFDNDGHMTNGHHRCHAVIESGVTIDVIVMSGGITMIDSLMSTDSGISRKLSDVLTMLGETNTVPLAAAIRCYYAYNVGGVAAIRAQVAGQLTLSEAVDVLAAHPGLRESVRVAESLRRAINAATGTWGALLYVLRTINENDHDAFVIALIDGDSLRGDDPRFLLRELMLHERLSHRKTPPWLVAALVLKAWNAYRDGRPMKQLAFRAGGSTPEAFPVAH